jgi:CelD/BcsL family acetyltransferase involved in cellulose biosynthesis
VEIPGFFASSEFEVRVLRRADELDAIAPAWDALVLAGRGVGPCMLAGWIATRMRFAPERHYAVLTAWRGDRLLAGFAIATARRSGLTVAEAIGGWDDYFSDLLFLPGEDEAARGVLRAVRSEPVDAVDYYGIRAGSMLAEIAGTSLVTHRRSHILHAEMPDGFDAFLKSKLSTKSRSGLRRKARHLDELGGLEFERIREPDRLRAMLPDLFRLHDARWDAIDDREDLSSFGDEARRGFEADALARLAADGYARMSVARVAGTPIAFSYWFAVGSSMFSYRLAFDPQGAHARFSPGLLTFLDACEMAAEEGMRRIEFGRGLEEYKERLHDGRGWLYEGLGLTASNRGRLAVPALTTAIRARRAAAEVPFARRVSTALRNRGAPAEPNSQ